MSGTYGGIQTPLKSGLPLCSRGAGPAAVVGRGEAPDAGGSWAAVNETLAASASSTAAAIAEQNREFTGCLRILAACLAGSGPAKRQAAGRRDMIAQQTRHRLARGGRLGARRFQHLTRGKLTYENDCRIGGFDEKQV